MICNYGNRGPACTLHAEGIAQLRVLIRWRILGLLFAFSLVGYVQRTSVAIAAERMMPTLGLSQVQVGWLLTAFLVGYTVFQVPGAIAGGWLGARRTITGIGLLTVLATCATALTPNMTVAAALLPILLLARFTLGVAQAALYPVCSGAIEEWFPLGSWSFAQGVLVAGTWLGAAVTGPLVAWLMGQWNWQFALYASSIPSLLLVAFWQWYARDRPTEHPGVAVAELRELLPNHASKGEPTVVPRSIARLLHNRSLWLVTISYFLTNYVFYLVTFWCFLYLIQDRHFSALEGGWLSSLPFIAAAVAGPAGGNLSDRLCARFGARIGFRVLPLVALPAAAFFLYQTVTAVSPYWAVATLSLSFACVELTEGPFWAAAMRVAPANSMNATAALNTGGNLGGVVATPIIAALSATHSWASVFATGAALSVVAAILWIWIDVTTPSNAAAASSRGRIAATDTLL
jgi:ACS family glucarate transporter-like MFS transporter